MKVIAVIVLLALVGCGMIMLAGIGRVSALRAETKTAREQLDVAENALREINADPDGAQTHAQVALNELRTLRDRETN